MFERQPVSIFSRLYRGETSFSFVGRARWWFSISLVVIAAGLASLGLRGLNLSIDFKGGVSWQVAAKNVTVPEASRAVTRAGLSNPTVTILGNRTISVDAKVTGSDAHRNQVENRVSAALAKLAHTNPQAVAVSYIGPSWGSNISDKAVEALVIFFAAIAIYISVRFEWRMAVAAIVAVVHDLLVTVGVYSLSGFQVTPDTVIAVLTILGYSLYDTVVVFDRVEDNVRGIGGTGKLTYSDIVDLSMNQVLMRSVNTSLVAIIPILSVLVLGAYILGATTLQDFGLALTIGLTSGAYSSIFIASPLLAILKERETKYRTIRKRLEAKGLEHQRLSPAEIARQSLATAGQGGGRGRSPSASMAASRGVIVPGSARRRVAGGREPDGDDELVAVGGPAEGSSEAASVVAARPRKKRRRR
jgi:preprotein translocase subunit SecF